MPVLLLHASSTLFLEIYLCFPNVRMPVIAAINRLNVTGITSLHIYV